jgi:hypothetical protein
MSAVTDVDGRGRRRRGEAPVDGRVVVPHDAAVRARALPAVGRRPAMTSTSGPAGEPCVPS